MQATVETTRYVRSHGRKPSRTAMGVWGFCVNGGEVVWSGTATYSEAVAWVRTQVGNTSTVEVMP